MEARRHESQNAEAQTLRRALSKQEGAPTSPGEEEDDGEAGAAPTRVAMLSLSCARAGRGSLMPVLVGLSVRQAMMMMRFRSWLQCPICMLKDDS